MQVNYLMQTQLPALLYQTLVLIQVLTKLYVPNAFSPNGDGLTDTWLIPALKACNKATIVIFNRYGEKVFELQGYNTPWDG